MNQENTTNQVDVKEVLSEIFDVPVTASADSVNTEAPPVDEKPVGALAENEISFPDLPLEIKRLNTLVLCYVEQKIDLQKNVRDLNMQVDTLNETIDMIHKTHAAELVVLGEKMLKTNDEYEKKIQFLTSEVARIGKDVYEPRMTRIYLERVVEALGISNKSREQISNAKRVAQDGLRMMDFKGPTKKDSEVVDAN